MAILQTKTDQVCDVLREGMRAGRWRGYLPGRARLASELGCSHWIVEEAMQRLSRENLLVSEGAGRRRRIELPKDPPPLRPLRVRVLLYEREDRSNGKISLLLDGLHRAGFAANCALKSLQDLGMNVGRVARFVEKTEADAWIVCAGSRDVLEWFAQQDVPAIARLGRFTGLPIACAGVRAVPAMLASVRRLAELGHQRIVLLAAEERRKPYPGFFESEFLKELDALGMSTGPYNLPDWDDHGDGLRSCLNGLFRHSPPSALICEETRIFVAAQQYLARRGIHAPEDVSLISADWDASFSWCKPTVAHYRWDHEAIVRRVVRWVENVARGKADKRQVLQQAAFVEGGTIGPAREKR